MHVIVATRLLERLAEHKVLQKLISDHVTVHKMYVKVVQRIGLVSLKQRAVPWRYMRGKRSLAENLSTSTRSSEAVETNGTVAAVGGDSGMEDPIPENLDEIVDVLLHGLCGNVWHLQKKKKNLQYLLSVWQNTIVRWSSAKGLGRLAERLPKEMASEILLSCIGSMTDNATDANFWHGGCLMLAEFTRRGLLLPDQLGSVFPLLFKALVFDQRQGSFSLGANVRDAACYVAWGTFFF